MHRPWSARARRRLLRAGIVLAVVLGVTAVVLLMPQPHREAETFHNTPADVPTPSPHRVKASPELQKLLVGETAAFVRTAVLRRNLDASWPLIHPALKQGMSLKEWRTGAIPVIPFPAHGILDWNVDWAYEDDVAADVVLQPEPKSGLYRKTFTIEFKRVGNAEQNRWLVYSWVPNGVSEALIDNEHNAGVQAALDRVHGHRGLSVAWVLIPLGGILAVFMLPIVLFLVERRRSRRAEAAHQAALAARQTSSSSPS